MNFFHLSKKLQNRLDFLASIWSSPRFFGTVFMHTFLCSSLLLKFVIPCLCSYSTHLLEFLCLSDAVWCWIKHRETLALPVMCYADKWACKLVEIVDFLVTGVKLCLSINHSFAIVYHWMKIIWVSVICLSEPFLDNKVCLLVALDYRHLTFKLSFILVYIWH
jgi:hypothetical protein